MRAYNFTRLLAPTRCRETFWSRGTISSLERERESPLFSFFPFFSRWEVKRRVRDCAVSRFRFRETGLSMVKSPIGGAETIGGGPRVRSTGRDRSASGVRALGRRRREASAARRPASIVEARGPLRPSNPYNPVAHTALLAYVYAYVVNAWTRARDTFEDRCSPIQPPSRFNSRWVFNYFQVRAHTHTLAAKRVLALSISRGKGVSKSGERGGSAKWRTVVEINRATRWKTSPPLS